MAETPLNPNDPQRPEQKPPKPEQIWPPPAPKIPPAEEEQPVDLEWSDEVDKIDEAIAEIRKINNGSTTDEEIEFVPAVIDEGPALADVPVTRGASSAPRGPAIQAAWRIRPQTENEIAQLWSNTFLSVDHPAPKLILVTAARRGDGATQIAFSLALVGADSTDELQICLVDFNFRQPAIAHLLGIKSGRGLTDVLMGTARLDEAIHTVTFKSGRRLSVLPSGSKAEHALSLIKSRQVKSVMTQLRDRFDHTIIDTASASTYPDAQILGSQTDGALLVVRASDTPRETVAEAKKRLDLSGSRCLGLVMNQRTDPIPGLLYEMT